MTEFRKITQLAFRKFLSSEEGKEGMLVLRERTPSVHRGESHDIIFDAGVVEGYRRALDTISEIIATPKDREESFDNV